MGLEGCKGGDLIVLLIFDGTDLGCRSRMWSRSRSNVLAFGDFIRSFEEGNNLACCGELRFVGNIVNLLLGKAVDEEFLPQDIMDVFGQFRSFILADDD